MHASFQGKKFVVTGTLTTMTRAQAKESILNRGGKISSSVSSKTDYLIAGKAAGSKLSKANMLGVKVLTETQFKAILDGKNQTKVENLAPKTPAPKPVDLNQALMAFRELTYNDPTRESWRTMCDLLDRCSPEVEPLAADYVKSHIAHWPLPPNPFTLQSHYRPEDLAPGEAPQHWNEQIVRGDDSPKFHAVKILSLPNEKLTGKMALNILKCGLSSLQVLILRGNEKIAGNFYKKLLESNDLPNLTHLDLSYWKAGTSHAKAFDNPKTQLTSLTHLDLSRGRFPTGDGFQKIIQSPALRNLKHLNLYASRTSESYGRNLDATHFDALCAALDDMKQLEHLNLTHTFRNGAAWEKLFSHPNLTHLQLLKVDCCHINPGAFQHLANNPSLANLETLEAFECGLTDKEFFALAASTHLKSLKKLTLYNNKLSGKSIEALMESPWLPQISEIRFDNNHQIKETDLPPLYASQHVSNLEAIYVRNSSQSGNALIQAIAHNPHLTKLKSLVLCTERTSDDTLLELAQSPLLKNLHNLYLERENPHSHKIKQAFNHSPTIPDKCKITVR